MTSIASLPSDYRALIEGCGLLDRSERGKLALSGGEAKAFLQGQVTNDVEALEPGTGCYAALLTPKGKMLADLRVLDTGTELLLDTERGALQGLFNATRRTMIGYDAELHKRTLERGLVSLIGPEAPGLAGVECLAGEPEHSHLVHEIGEVPVRAVRTEVGIDLLCDSAHLSTLMSALEHAGARPVGEDIAEVIRVERGRPRYGVDLDETVIPQEAGLNERAVSFTKGCYVGQETVARLHYRGKPNRHLRGLRLSAPAAPGDPIIAGQREVGRLASVVVSPRLGPIALALVRREVAVGDSVSIGAGTATAQVVQLPFA
ncbi:MAG TPA: glycine cleavage T C-terminal barrel domain-containing protein [Solirubrobacteraceae bacterium]|nr:glycine cleavage T C-terminal barrel domain-containing protein [Solirubrobacteraceae bacterium]